MEVNRNWDEGQMVCFGNLKGNRNKFSVEVFFMELYLEFLMQLVILFLGSFVWSLVDFMVKFYFEVVFNMIIINYLLQFSYKILSSSDLSFKRKWVKEQLIKGFRGYVNWEFL